MYPDFQSKFSSGRIAWEDFFGAAALLLKTFVAVCVLLDGQSRVSSLPGLFTVNSVNDECSTLLQRFSRWMACTQSYVARSNNYQWVRVHWGQALAIFTTLSCIGTWPILCRLGSRVCCFSAMHGDEVYQGCL